MSAGLFREAISIQLVCFKSLKFFVMCISVGSASEGETPALFWKLLILRRLQNLMSYLREKSGPMPSKKNMFSIYLPALVILQINTHKIFKHCVMEDKPLQQSSPALVHHLATTDTSTRTTLKPFTCIHMSAYPGISQNPPNPIVESCSTWW